MMTRNKARKTAVRALMAETGRPFAEAARRLDEQRAGTAFSAASGDERFAAPPTRVAASILFTDETDRVLLVRRPDETAGWVLPGRYLEPAETAAGASVAAVLELLGIAPTIGRMLVVDWAPFPDYGTPEGIKAEFVFEGGRLTAELVARIELDPAELAEYAFCERADLGGLMNPHLTRRISAALAARSGASGGYLELGLGGR